MRSTALSLWCLLALCSCQPAPKWEGDLREKVKARTEGVVAEPAPPIDQITLEKRADGVFHQTGQDKPFTGRDVEPGGKGSGPDDTTGMTVVTPYRDGRIDGAKTTYYPKGGVREKRVYANGLAQESTLFFPPSKGGGKKLHVKLNAKDQGQGPVIRWHPGGQLFTEASFDENEQWDGDFKEYAEDGKLNGHYRWAHGTLVEIVFETPEQKAAREKEKPDVKAAPNP